MCIEVTTETNLCNKLEREHACTESLTRSSMVLVVWDSKDSVSPQHFSWRSGVEVELVRWNILFKVEC